MKDNIQEFTQFLKDFEKLPKEETSPTFLEICKYPYSRYEEVCSRILQFFFNPNAEHKMGDLWVTALLNMIDYIPMSYRAHDIEVITEENANGKRIDLTIKTHDFVIAIENKITADLYNPLDVYRNYILKNYPEEEHKFLVLSVRKFSDNNSKKWIAQNGFEAYTYQNLFQYVNQNLGNYITHCDQKYLSFMLDFMKTINNMEHENTKEENDFFFDNEDTIKNLLNRYNQFQNRLLNKQKEQIDILRNIISQETKQNWWAWQGWDLGIKLNEKTHGIGIESNYSATKESPCGEFHIFITTWNQKDWVPYKDAILEEFPEHTFLDEKTNNRIYLHLPIIKGNDTNNIVEKLKDIFFRLQNTLLKNNLQ